MPKLPVVAHVVGARPNYMKIAPIWARLSARGDVIQKLVHTGQHYDRTLNDIFFDELPLPDPDIQLHIGSGSHAEQTGQALIELERVFVTMNPQLVVVPGDVNSTLAGALAAAKVGVPVCHVEAGLRSFDRSMPEEHNRRLTDHLASLLLTHSETAVENLSSEGIAGDHVVFVGNTMIDSLYSVLPRATALEKYRELGLERGSFILVTLHRPALVDTPHLLRETLSALADIATEYPVIFPIHPRTRAHLDGGTVPAAIQLVEPMSYSAFVSLEAAAAAVITDSGGVQEETTALGVRCFTLRDNTERPVTVSHGTNDILGLEPNRVRDVPRLLRNPKPSLTPPLWDGRAAGRAADAIAAFVGANAPD